MAYALCIENLDTTIVQLGNIVSGALGGPLLAVFTMGVFLPWCNTKVCTKFEEERSSTIIKVRYTSLFVGLCDTRKLYVKYLEMMI